MRKILALSLGITLLYWGAVPARAQTTARLSLYALQTDSFPVITAGLDVFDASGNFVSGLTRADISLLEDTQSRPVTALEEFQPGTEFALALDPGPFFAYRDVNAVTRMDKIMKALKEWAAVHPDSLGDDLNFIPTGGTPATHLDTTAAFTGALSAYKPDLNKLVSSPQTLSAALDAVSESSSQPGRKPVVLYITNIPAEGDLPQLQNLSKRAVAGFIRVDVWIVSSQAFFSTSGATALKDLAIQTGGESFLFSGAEQLPNPDTYLAPLRHTYQLEYSSGILSSGTHTLAVQVTLEGEPVSSADLPFDLDVQPPNPMLVAPPQQVVRTAPDARTTSPTAFIPTQQAISIIIEFPDKRTRSLVRTILYVDGIQVAENTSAPFDQFTWDLKGYITSAQHILTVKAVDSYGLSKVSLGVPVLVTIVKPQFGFLPWLSRNSQAVALGAILFAGGGLVVILTRSRVRNRRKTPNGRRSRLDPVTQPIHPERRKSDLQQARKKPVKSADAYLVRLKEDGQPITAPPIPIASAEIIFGSDPIQATYILDDPSVSPRHARLMEKDGEYILCDEKSVAGTWINYEQLTGPRSLTHGDVIHFGSMSYRFMLRKPPELPTLRVTPVEKNRP
jgi:hypothetical protein